jgi:ApaG protein
MHSPIQELPGLWVGVDSVEYSNAVQASPQLPHAFIYHVTIHNDSTRTITIKGRKWIVTTKAGEKSVIEGDGVVGEFPRLAPGQSFPYNSYHLIKFDSFAEGAYFGQDDHNHNVLVRIPKFEMIVPLL